MALSLYKVESLVTTVYREVLPCFLIEKCFSKMSTNGAQGFYSNFKPKVLLWSKGGSQIKT